MIPSNSKHIPYDKDADRDNHGQQQSTRLPVDPCAEDELQGQGSENAQPHQNEVLVPVHAAIVDATQVVVLVDDQGIPTGTMDKLAAHSGAGALHSAFSVFLYDTAGRVLLQRRAAQKHHFRNKWSNTCCSHPLPGETVTAAASRRLLQEVGITASAEVVGSFTYRAPDLDSGLIEVEFDYVLIGEYEGDVSPNPDEVSEVQWVNFQGLREQIALDPEAYTPWLTLALDVIEQQSPTPI